MICFSFSLYYTRFSKHSGFAGQRKKSLVTKTRSRAGLAFTHRRPRRYNLSTPMAHQRHNPSALHDPKVSIVIPVYNEKSTIDEILRRVLGTQKSQGKKIVGDCASHRK